MGGFALLLQLLGCTETSLQEAICEKDINRVSEILDAGWDVNAEFEKGFAQGFTPLTLNVTDHVCNPPAAGPAPQITKLLIERGADVNKHIKKYGLSTALHEAAISGELESTRILIENGADPNAVDSKGATPMILLSSGSVELAKLLIRAGADLRIQAKDGRTALSNAEALSDKALVEIIESNLQLQ